jgi:PAS domain S-box-containing protein
MTWEKGRGGSLCADQIVFTVNPDGYFTYVNLAGELLLGYSFDELLQMNLTEIVAIEQREYVQQQITDFTDERLGAVYEIEIVTKNGSRMPVEMSTRVVTRDARAIALHGIALPVTGADFGRSNRARCLDERFTFLVVF